MPSWGDRGKGRQAGSSLHGADDQELAERAKRDPEAFGALYDRHFQRIYRLVYLQVRNQVLARDLTSQVFFRALKHIKRYRPSGNPFSTWLRMVALMTLARHGHLTRPRSQAPGTDNGYQPAGRPAPLPPRLPTLSAAAAVPLPPIDEGPGIVYALGR